MTEKESDILVTAEGSIFTFTLLTEAARDWVTDNVDIPDYMWIGELTFACEHRFAPDIVTGAQLEGLIVESE